MGVTGIHPEAGLTTGDAEEAVMKRAIAEASGELVVMASSEKLLAASSFVILDANRANTVLVPDDTKEATVRQFTSLGIEVIHAR
jgi:DeoR/GlpR family transcriptional regulator of sugar metabolism